MHVRHDKIRIISTAFGPASSRSVLARIRMIEPMKILIAVLILGLSGVAFSQDRNFYFGSREAPKGKTPVSASDVYSREKGFGFEPGNEVKCAERACTSNKPFYFSAAVPEGNYRVTIRFGEKQVATTTVVK